MIIARVFVEGRSRTKGSLKPVHIKIGAGRCKVSLTEDHALATPWKKKMIAQLLVQQGLLGLIEPYAGPVEIHCFFRFAREEAAGGGVWPSHESLWPTAPDIGDEDKLRRNVLDALTQAHVIADDALSIGGMNYKRWCDVGEQPGVQIIVSDAPAPDAVRYLERLALLDV
jgi:Holliday junction resolvase RusA-like endonuclease